MDRISLTVALATVLVATASPTQAADIAHGLDLFRQCAACHGAGGAGTDNGPPLIGIVGRKAGAAEGFRYSAPMKRSPIVWDTATLTAFVTDPQGTVKGTRMPFAGLKNPGDADDVVAYLQRLN
jgi:cytochrome c